MVGTPWRTGAAPALVEFAGTSWREGGAWLLMARSRPPHLAVAAVLTAVPPPPPPPPSPLEATHSTPELKNRAWQVFLLVLYKMFASAEKGPPHSVFFAQL